MNENVFIVWVAPQLKFYTFETAERYNWPYPCIERKASLPTEMLWLSKVLQMNTLPSELLRPIAECLGANDPNARYVVNPLEDESEDEFEDEFENEFENIMNEFAAAASRAAAAAASRAAAAAASRAAAAASRAAAISYT